MRKLVMTIAIALHGTIAHSSDVIQMEWHVGEDKYTIENSPYNEENVTVFQNIAKTFHDADKEGLDKILTYFEGKSEKYNQFVDQVLHFRANQLKNSTGSLLLIKKNDQEIVGGNYYITEHNGAVVRVTLGGWMEALGLAYAYTINVLSSPQYFLDAQKLIIFLRTGSSLAPLLYDKFGFKDSDYKYPANEPEELYATAFQSYEKPIGE